MSEDKINQAYDGSLGQQEAEKTRARIHWICENVRGPRVLDVGCSQGITSILLGREGLEMVGVDINPSAIADAEATLEQETEHIRKNISFVQSPFEDFVPDPDRRFDTVIMGEVLEHLVCPSAFVEKAHQLLADDGLLVLTTPFGLFEHPDHKRTFYVNNLLQVVGPRFIGVSLDIRNPYIRYVGKRRPDEVAEISLASLRAELGDEELAAIEMEVFEARERIVHRELCSVQETRRSQHDVLTKANSELRDFSVAFDEQSRELGVLTEAAVDLEQRLSAALEDASIAKSRFEASDDRLKEALALGDHFRIASRKAEEVLELERRKLQALESAREKADKKVETLSRHLSQARTQLAVVNARLDRSRERFEGIVSSNRFRVGHYFWEAVRSPVAALTLPSKLAQVGLSYLRSDQPDRPLPSNPSPSLSSSTVWRREPAQRDPLCHEYHPGRAVEVVRSEDLWVAAILDEMSSACFEPDCNLITFTPNEWRRVLEARPPHILLVESAWKGNDGSWQYKVGSYNHPDAGGLAELVDWCRKRGIPTVFWNKEDPVHFEKFKEAAKLFDHVFTTDSNLLDRYRALGGAIKSVDSLPFAAQPSLHNPISAGPRDPAPCFAGSYYGNRHHLRREQQEALLDAARPFDLVIYDRNHGSDSADFRFPDRFSRHIRGRLPYRRLSSVYKQHRVFLNVNSVVDSPTMLSRRVFELLASGTPVVSTPSQGVTSIFGDLVATVSDEKEAAQAISRLLTDEVHWREISERGWRFVMSEHTYRDRLVRIAAAAGIEIKGSLRERPSAVLLDQDLGQMDEFTALWEALAPHCAEVLVGTLNSSTGASLKRRTRAVAGVDCNLRVISQSNADRQSRIRQLSAMAHGERVLLIGANADCSTDKVSTLVATSVFSDADVIGLPCSDADGHAYVDELRPELILARRTIIADRGWAPTSENMVLADWRKEGLRLYATGSVDTAAGVAEPIPFEASRRAPTR